MERPRHELLRAILALLVVTIVLYLLTYFIFPDGPVPGLRDLFGTREPDKLGVIIHHAAAPPVLNGRTVGAAEIDDMHRDRGFRMVYGGKTYHIGYHFVVLQDGTVEEGRPIEAHGAHAGDYYHNEHYIGICLVGDYDHHSNPGGRRGPTCPPEAQLGAARDLIVGLCRRYDFDADDVLRHSDVRATLCPGDRFPFEELRESVRSALRGEVVPYP